MFPPDELNAEPVPKKSLRGIVFDYSNEVEHLRGEEKIERGRKFLSVIEAHYKSRRLSEEEIFRAIKNTESAYSWVGLSDKKLKELAYAIFTAQEKI